MELENKGYSPVIQKFAQPLYDMQDYIYGRVRRSVVGSKDRKLLQWLGTEWGRSIDHNLWVDIWKLDAKNTLFFDDNKIIICDDVRFNNEAQAVKDLGGIIIKVNAPVDTVKRRISATNIEHDSEKGIDKEYITANIYNDGSLIDLDQQVSYLLDNLGV